MENAEEVQQTIISAKNYPIKQNSNSSFNSNVISDQQDDNDDVEVIFSGITSDDFVEVNSLIAEEKQPVLRFSTDKIARSETEVSSLDSFLLYEMCSFDGTLFDSNASSIDFSDIDSYNDSASANEFFLDEPVRLSVNKTSLVGTTFILSLETSADPIDFIRPVICPKPSK